MNTYHIEKCEEKDNDSDYREQICVRTKSKLEGLKLWIDPIAVKCKVSGKDGSLTRIDDDNQVSFRITFGRNHVVDEVQVDEVLEKDTVEVVDDKSFIRNRQRRVLHENRKRKEKQELDAKKFAFSCRERMFQAAYQNMVERIYNITYSYYEFRRMIFDISAPFRTN